MKEPIEIASTQDILTQMLNNQQEFQKYHAALATNLELVSQITHQQEKHLEKLNSHVATNQKLIAQNSQAVAVALERLRATDSKISMLWKIVVPIITAMIGAFLALALNS